MSHFSHPFCSRGLPYEPKGAQGTHKGPKKAPILESLFAQFPNFRDSGARWAWKAATRSHSLPKRPQKAPKSDPGCFKNVKIRSRDPQKRHSKIRRPPPPAITSSIRQVLEGSAAEAVACKSAALFKVKSYAGVSGDLLVEAHSSTSTVQAQCLFKVT